MANDGIVPITAGTGTDVDVSTLTVGSNTVNRQRMVISDDSSTGGLAQVSGYLPASGSQGLIVRPLTEDTWTNGTLTSVGNTIYFGVINCSSWAAHVSGSWTGSLSVQGYIQNDSGSFINLNCIQVDNGNTSVGTNITTNGLYQGNCANMTVLQVIANSGFSGSASVNFTANPSVSSVTLSPGSTVNLNQNPGDIIASGSITGASQTVSVTPHGSSAWVVGISGTWSGNLVFEGTVDGTNYFALNGRQTGSTVTTVVNNYTDTGSGVSKLFRGNLAGMTTFRVRASAWTSGTATINIHAAVGEGSVFLNAAIPAGTDNIGSIQIADGTTNTQLTKVDTNGNLGASINDLGAAIALVLELLTNPMNQDPSTSRVRQSLENIAAGVTLPTVTTVGTVTTVSTLTNLTQAAGFDIKQSLLYDASLATWASSIRNRIT